MPAFPRTERPVRDGASGGRASGSLGFRLRWARQRLLRRLVFPSLGFAVLLVLLLPMLGGCGGTPVTSQAAETSDLVPLTTSSPEARRLYEAAVDLGDKLRRDDARRLYAMALEHDPHLAMGYYGLAMTAPTAGQYREGIDRAVALADSVSDGERWAILAAAAGIEKDLEKQDAYLEQLVETYPRDPRVHLLRGWHLLNKGKNDKLLAELDAALHIAPDFAPAYNLRGYALQRLGRREEAVAAFRRYIELIPGEANPYDSYGELLLVMGRYEEAVRSYQQALARNARFPSARRGLGIGQLYLGRLAEARATFRQLENEARLPGDKVNALIWRLATYLSEEQALGEKGALEELAKIAEASDAPDLRARIALAVGCFAVEKGDFVTAEQALTRARQILDGADEGLPRRAQLWRSLHQQSIRLAITLGRLDEAESLLATLRDLETEMADTPKFRETMRRHTLEAQLALARGQTEKVLEIVAEETEPSAGLLYVAARAHLALGDPEHAREAASQAAERFDLDWTSCLVRPRALALLAEVGPSGGPSTGGASAGGDNDGRAALR